MPIACGLAALNCLRRRGLAWDLAACIFLVAGVASQGFALPFLAGAFVLLAIREDRILPRSAWVVAVPLVLYGLWFVWSRTHNAGQFIEDPVGFSNIAQVPGTIVALCAVGLSAITGTFRQPSIVEFDLSAGYALLAVLAVVAIIRWQGAAGPPSRRIWVPVVMMLVYGALVGLALSGVRTPTNSRYVYLATLLVLLFGLAAHRRAAVLALGLGHLRSRVRRRDRRQRGHLSRLRPDDRPDRCREPCGAWRSRRRRAGGFARVHSGRRRRPRRRRHRRSARVLQRLISAVAPPLRLAGLLAAGPGR